MKKKACGRRMVGVPVVAGRETFWVSRRDLPFFQSVRWTTKVYNRDSGNRYTYLRDPRTKECFHRMILGLRKGDPRMADHIDGNTKNNVRSNLRIIDPRGNARNSKTWGSSGYKGVYPHSGSWRVMIRDSKHSRLRRIGTYPTAKEAALAYDQHCRQTGRITRLNFPSIFRYPRLHPQTRQTACLQRATTAAAGFRGVVRRQKHWRAQIKIHGVNRYLGAYATAEEAALAYDKAARKAFGASATMNFPKT